ncbi:INO80 complex subunit B [Trichogramma pretiosum]|uniref:INO80 complex subunit B n=1 Tax=Trichogramma pretiosum TaxID=7493 RepID=UPI0006C9A99B|nr:INO80 complex subunit B [Trichogramma pretiosum]
MKEESSNEDIAGDNSNSFLQKRHKKHKHRKHKKKKLNHQEISSCSDVTISRGSELKKTFKVKIRQDTERSTEKTKIKVFKMPQTSVSTSLSPKGIVKKKIIKTNKGKESGTSSEEERWLDAIESGKLEEVDDELKKIKPKDPKLMTARQRAMFERKTDTEPNSSMEQLMSLPTGYKEKVMTAEAIQKAALKSLKRKQLADEKREKDKKKTMERLLKKQESKTSKVVMKNKQTKKEVPLVTYKVTLESSTISLPEGESFPLATSKVIEIPKPKHCAVSPCKNLKKYFCSKTGIPLCSLTCYKRNLNKIIS